MSDLLSRLASTLTGRYTVERELGGGGMSRVFIARDVALGRDVVVKILSPELAEGLSGDRFTREIQLAAQLQQANIVPVLAAGESDGLPWYVMPYVRGRSLRERLGQGPVPHPEALSILRDVARALAYAHREGIVHRDIKPENILLSEGTAVVTDFGIAKALSASRTRAPGGTLTEIGTSLGTPAYMSPEQATGDKVDHRADIYAWALVAYELLAGAHPFAYAKGPQQFISAQIADTPEPLETVAPDVNRNLARAVMASLAKSPDDRPGDAGALLAALDNVTSPQPRFTARVAKGARLRLATMGLAALVILVIGVVAVSRRASFVSTNAQGVVILPVEAERGSSGNASGALMSNIPDVLTERVSRLSWVRLGAPHAAITVVPHVYPLGDSVDLSIRISTRDGVLRTLPTVRVSAHASAATLRQATDPVVAAVGFATHPLLSSALLPLDLPSSQAFIAFSTALDIIPRLDTLQRQAWPHLRAALRLDTNFLQPALWLVFSQKKSGIYNRGAGAMDGDSILVAMGARRQRLTVLEGFMLEADRYAGTASTDLWIDAMRKLAAAVPGSLFADELPAVLAEIGRVHEAIAVESRQYDARPPAFDSSALYHRQHWLRLSSFYHHTGDYAKQLDAVHKARPYTATDLTVVREELMALAGLGDSTGFDRALAQVASGSSNNRMFAFPGDVYLTAGQDLVAHGHPAHGRAVIAQAVGWFDTRTPQNLAPPAIALRAALAYFVVGRLDDAERITKRLYDANPLDARLAGLLGRIAAARHDSAGARHWSEYVTSIPNNQNQGTGTYERAAIAARLGDKERALALLEEASAQGLYFSLRARLHYFPEWYPYKGDERFERIIRPVD